MIEITWVRGSARGTRDLIPSEWFEDEGLILNMEHLLVDLSDQSTSSARCAVNVSGSEAELDYSGKHQNFNTEAGCDIGQMRLVFNDASRETVDHVLWRDEGGEYKAAPVLVTLIDDEGILSSPSYPEGKAKIVQHLSRERRAGLRRKKIEEFAKGGAPLECEACKFNFSAVYPNLGDGFCEVHHRNWLASGGERKTLLPDLAILCANCHRMIHRTNMLSVEEFAKGIVVAR